MSYKRFSKNLSESKAMNLTTRRWRTYMSFLAVVHRQINKSFESRFLTLTFSGLHSSHLLLRPLRKSLMIDINTDQESIYSVIVNLCDAIFDTFINLRFDAFARVRALAPKVCFNCRNHAN
jgi:hypothetical protein